MIFLDKLNQNITNKQSLFFVGLDPNPEMIPERYQDSDLLTSLDNWLQFVIEETADFVCAYKPTLGFYQALGVRGIELLIKIMASIPKEVPIILDAKHGDLNTTSMFAHSIFVDWGVDAVTLNPYAGQDHIAPFLVYPDKAVFILCCTSNPSAAILQQYPATSPFYLQVVQESKTWGTPEQLCLEVGTTNPEILKSIRSAAPERIIMVRSIWSQENSIQPILAAGLDSHGDGLLIPVPQDMLISANLSQEIGSLRTELNQIRSYLINSTSSCDVWFPDVNMKDKHPHQDLILQLFDIGCIMFGEFVQASGAIFPYYIDLRKIISNPQVFSQVIGAYEKILAGLTFDRLAGIPYGSLPTATGLSLRLGYPMIFPRKEVKAHGTRKAIEGNFLPGETIAVVDDILISGKSVMEGAEKIKSVGLTVNDIVVFIDHEKGVKEKLKENGYFGHSVLTISEIVNTLYEAGRINRQQLLAFQQE
ncbi:MAG: bifunctional orotidine-5'-phosphate decarboxylase/orotate phosphoribosyltransferase [Cylindrospermopsis raciborskii PAMP2012]|uniref:bifunctional orotidine-5'-phosphate decarboxylase/orotate phosphoribosyltransferase n=1 Tax=Cylindrospermopsis raciborskii TaxID=77022 RepID=UPI000C1B85CB|nr:bifunctional orotidine-5'-phosphate decarboxylase/orotate phosphoribosyltransferase [Cylindrospermopsis raciborskii]MCZ2201549.1 bifunctional orotidine-5'-phosphate decarboxylase/orotate phosphoribosyltransferase [Cylindrospermopsis raciborskii PAMP2012]